ncbi:MAG: CDF family Co(II)/Ni(II) efflux transporter DmeF [Deltaproteobacteria bacterium]|nr:CDF family Co(II)/Ni(II) efflux transporter DmeF [Deltaproteobacteria bacterium]
MRKNELAHHHNYLLDDYLISENERRTLTVVFVTAMTMLIEIIAGYLTGSMALLADGWHMASHAGALAISYFAYKLARSEKLTLKFSFGAGKFIPLGGYTSAIVLALIALWMAGQSVSRLLNPVPIYFDEALVVCTVGLIVNILCARVLSAHHEEEQGHGHVHDHNLRSAYFHVLADAFTSILALVALLFGKFYRVVWLDPLMGLVGSALILRWAYLLCKETVWELLDGHAKAINQNEIRQAITKTGATVSDLHVWRIAPSAYACEVVVCSKQKRGTAYYRELLLRVHPFGHLTIEEIEQS